MVRLAHAGGHESVAELLLQNGFEWLPGEEDAVSASALQSGDANSAGDDSTAPADATAATGADGAPLPRHHEGLLQLFDAASNQWREYFAVFDVCVLAMHDVEDETIVLKRLPLEILSDARAGDDGDRSFALTTVANKTHMLAAEDAAAREQWVHVLKVNIDAIPDDQRVSGRVCKPPPPLSPSPPLVLLMRVVGGGVKHSSVDARVVFAFKVVLVLVLFFFVFVVVLLGAMHTRLISPFIVCFVLCTVVTANCSGV